jgi:hypothetical protein
MQATKQRSAMNPLRAPHVTAAVAECRRAGIEPAVSLTRGGHVRIAWAASGQKVVVFTSATPSDHRILHNIRAEVRRKMREATP